MASYECIVQEGSAASKLQAELRRELTNIENTVRDVSGYNDTVDFVVVPRGSGFTAGELSTTSIVNVELPHACHHEVRNKVMTQVCARWYRTTGCSAHELVVFTTEAPVHR